MKNSKMMEETSKTTPDNYVTFVHRRKILGRYMALLMSLNFFWDCGFIGAIQNARQYFQTIIKLLRKEHQQLTVSYYPD
jgi:hypothetical protein